MTDPQDAIERYNYSTFHPRFFEPIMNWDQSPALGADAPDFPLWTLDEEETSLSAQWQAHKYLIVEFGSFT